MDIIINVNQLVANIKIWKSHLNIREGSDYLIVCMRGQKKKKYRENLLHLSV